MKIHVIQKMFKTSFLMVCAFAFITLIGAAPNKRKRTFEETSRFDERLGIPIASDTLIHQYETEHKMMYRKADGTIDEVAYLAWPSKLGNKNLTEYCGKYLKAIIPRRHICNMHGAAEPVRVLYLNEGGQFEFNIGAIKCEVPLKVSGNISKAYHIIEAPQTDCVFSLKRTRKGKAPFTIVFKVCGFESNESTSFIHSNIKPINRRKSGYKIHLRTGIPIASDALIAEYEYKHHAMYKKDDGSIHKDKYEVWPLNRDETYLLNFCAEYLQAVVPNRVKFGLSGELDTFQVLYTQEDLMPLTVGIIKCIIPASLGVRSMSLFYYITESPKPNCVYSLLRTTSLLAGRIVYQICGIKSFTGMKGGCEPNPDNSYIDKELEYKPNLNTIRNLYINNLPVNDTEELEVKPKLETPVFFQ